MGFFDGLSGLVGNFISSKEKKDTGDAGEQFTNTLLENHFYGEFDLFQNVFLEKKSGSFIEADIIAVGSKAIILFESKDCSGLVFGSEKSKNWTQTLPSGEKQQFPNPTRQSKSHIETLRYTLSEYSHVPIYSFVLFSDHCELRDVRHTAPNTYVIQRNRLIPTLEELLKSLPSVIDKEDRKRIKVIMKKASRPADESSEKHLKNQAKRSEKCPKCGAEMKERKNKSTGKVSYACAAYPKCKYTAKELKTAQTSGKRK